MAEDSQSERGDVPQRARGDTGCDRAGRIPESDGAAFQAARQMCQFAAFPSGRTGAVLLEQRVRDVSGVGECGGDHSVDVSQSVQELEEPLEQNDPWAYI